MHPEAMENFLETAASGGLDLQLEGRIFTLLQNCFSNICSEVWNTGMETGIG